MGPRDRELMYGSQWLPCCYSGYLYQNLALDIEEHHTGSTEKSQGFLIVRRIISVGKVAVGIGNVFMKNHHVRNV
jgi:hypothetical protein